MKPYRIIHFVSGGGSGSTGMAVELAVGQHHGSQFEPMVVFRRKKKRNPNLDQIIAAEQIHFREVCAAPKLQTIKQLCAIIREFRPHILVAHGLSEHIWGRIAAWRAKVPVIIQVEHNNENYSLLRQWQSQFLLKFTAKVICVSEGVKRHLEKLGFKSDKIGVIYNGIATEEFTNIQNETFAGRDANIIMVARFAYQKDHATLIKAVKILQDGHYPCQTLLIGGGKQKYKEQCVALSRKLGLTATVRFLNHKTRAEIRELLGRTKIFVLATHHEGLPLALIEAMAAGCLVIASKVDGVSELIDHGQNGFLIPPQDPVALAQTIKMVFDNEQMAAAVAKSGQEKAITNFNMARMVNQYEQMFLDEITIKAAKC
jgi:glycosyltransferase involved in cell wall biosynthesis